MRLIDADALIKNDEVTEWLSINPIRTGKMLKAFSELFIKKVNEMPTINAISIPDNITNLDMMLKVYSTALIYKSDEKEVIVGIDNMFCQKFDRDWCDAPYKGVST